MKTFKCEFGHLYYVLKVLTVFCIVINFPGAFSLKLSFSASEEITSTESYTGAKHSRSVPSENVQVRSGLGSDDCNCTSLFQCDLGGNSKEMNSGEVEIDEDENGANLEVIDIRKGLTSTQTPGGFSCGHYLEICCNHYQRNPPSKQIPPRTGSNRPGNEQKEKRQQCGKRNSHGVGFRIVGGIEGEAQMGEFTWMIAVTELNKERQGTVYLCGGSLIHPRVVLTAAHCVENKLAENLRIRAGEWDTNTEREDPYIHYDRMVNQTIIHESYSKKGVLKNDIALIVLTRDVPMARHIGTICLSPDLNPSPSVRCFASGWGKHLYGRDGNYQSILKKVDLPIVLQSECQQLFRKTALGPKFVLHQSFVCAGGERGKDTCKGDGGSPLVCQIPGSDRYAQYGIVSWGLNCGDPVPGAYVNVPLFVPWIEQKISELGFDTNAYKVES